MRLKKEKGIVGTDMIVAVIAIMIFSTMMFSMIYSNIMGNVKLKKETLAMIYLTEIFENIAIAEYDTVTVDNKDDFIPNDMEDYEVTMTVTTELDGVTNSEDILKKVNVQLKYNVADKSYICSMQRMKIKE